MTGRFFVALLLLCCACGPDSAPGQVERGLLVLERTSPDPAPLTELEAAASYCARDTVFSIVASSPDWATAIAVRSDWPADSARTFAIDSTPGTAGHAAFAARVLRDSAQVAMIGLGGEVTVNGGRVLSGRFSAAVVRDSVPIELGGRFEGLTVVEQCP